MSGLWTPGGGDPPRQPPPPTEPSQAELEAAMLEELAAIRNTPAAVVVGNHAIQLFELARLHLTAEPPNFADAQLAIDAMAAVVESLAGRLGDDERTLADGLAQIRLAFVQLKAVQEAKDAGVPPPEGSGEA
jgi:hypothetical protein